jgi:electron transfer flavoprotein alpha subunit
MPSGILVFGELDQERVQRPALEAVSQARRLAEKLGGPVTAVVLGPGAAAAAARIEGADRSIAGGSDALAAYTGEAYAAAILAAISKVSPAAVLFPGSIVGKDLAPRVAASLRVACLSDCTALDVVDGSIEAVRPVFAGKANATVRSTTSPLVATLRPNVFAVSPGLSPPGAVEPLEFVPPEPRTTVKAFHEARSARVDLTQAQIIVSGGRGMKGPENYRILDELADALGAAVGASRAAVDAGWRPHSDQVGQTGKTVAPTLYIACGISGATQHLAGMSSSKVIVAINKDPQAPIFQVADYGIVGDLFEVVPALTEEVKRRRNR